MREGGLILVGFCLVFVLGTGIALLEMLMPVVTKARLDTICASFSEQMAISQTFEASNQAELVQKLNDAGLTAVEVDAEPMAALKRGDRARFLVTGEIKGRLLSAWMAFSDRRYAYQFERFVVCRKILN